jgi:hypothetical protein
MSFISVTTEISEIIAKSQRLFPGKHGIQRGSLKTMAAMVLMQAR